MAGPGLLPGRRPLLIRPSFLRREEAPWLLLLAAAVLSIYCPWPLLTGRFTLQGLDFWQCHVHRIRYAREAIFSASPTVPGWFTREFFGTPFFANIHSFPWIPTRLFLLLFDPETGYPVGVNLAALLSALFTFFYCRKIGLGGAGAAAAGWTFTCSGYFSSKVLSGHFVILEACPALPGLLWLVESVLSAGGDPKSRRALLGLLSFSTAAAALAAHPQVPAYTLVVVAAYTAFRAGRRSAPVGAALALGLGLALFAWGPALFLAARSTRALALDPPANDVPFLYGRLPALLLPWRDGWPAAVARFPATPFSFPTNSIFWDTTAYVGILPWAAAAFFGAEALLRRKFENRRALFWAAAGALALLTALPFRAALFSWMKGTLFRSPARQVFVTVFALSLAAGFLFDRLFKARGRWKWAALAGLAVFHGRDLALTARAFVQPIPRGDGHLPALEEIVRSETGDGRAATDYFIQSPLSRAVDDAGFFDGLVLARPYRALLALAGSAPTENHEWMRGSFLSRPLLSALGVRFVATPFTREDLPLRRRELNINLYEVPGPAPRASFVPRSDAVFSTEEDVLARLRASGLDPKALLLLREESPAAEKEEGPPASRGRVSYGRPSSDRIRVDASSDAPGFVRLLEAWDPGWSARVDGAPAPLLRADGFLMAVPVGPGEHRVELDYRTPGRAAGLWLSLLSLASLALFLRSLPRGP